MTTNQTIDGVTRAALMTVLSEPRPDAPHCVLEARAVLCAQLAEQPASVAVVMPERREISPNYPYLSDLDIEWNACLDELKRLNPSL